VQLVETVSSRIKEYDERIETLRSEKYPLRSLLRQVKGVGPITALAIRVTVEKVLIARSGGVSGSAL